MGDMKVRVESRFCMPGVQVEALMKMERDEGRWHILGFLSPGKEFAHLRYSRNLLYALN